MTPGFIVRAARGILGMGLLLGAVSSARVAADDRETPAQRDARLAAEILGQARQTLDAQTGFHIKGNFRLATSGPSGKTLRVDFEGITRCTDQVTQLTLNAPEVNPKAKVPSYKTLSRGIVRPDEKTGWVAFDQLPNPILTELVQSPTETLNIIWGAAYRVEASSSHQEVNKKSCRILSLPLTADAVRAVAPRFGTDNGMLSEEQSTARGTLWVGEDGLVYRVALQVSLVFLLPQEGSEDPDTDAPNPGIGGVGSTAVGKATDVPKPPGVVMRTYDVQMDISDYGKDVEFKIPADAEKKLYR